MRASHIIFAALLVMSGPVSAAPRGLYLYSKLDLPICNVEKQARMPGERLPLYIGSDKSYAAESKEVRVIGRSLTLGLAIAGLLQPFGLLASAGFLIVGAVNAKALVSDLTSKPARRSEWTFLWTKSK